MKSAISHGPPQHILAHRLIPARDLYILRARINRVIAIIINLVCVRARVLNLVNSREKSTEAKPKACSGHGVRFSDLMFFLNPFSCPKIKNIFIVFS